MQLLKAPSASGLALPRPVRRVVPGQVARPLRVVIAKAADEDAELEKRLEKLRLAKGATPYSQGSKKAAAVAPETPKQPAGKKDYDFSNETVYYEGSPATGDLVVNLVLGTTLLWLPLTLAAVGRAAFVKYRFTNKRLSVVTTAPWKSEQLDAAYQEVKSVKSIGRGVGLWGDMVVELRDGSKVEMRSVERYKELEKYILDRRDELAPRSNEVTQEALLGEDPLPSKAKGERKGFA